MQISMCALHIYVCTGAAHGSRGFGGGPPLQIVFLCAVLSCAAAPAVGLAPKYWKKIHPWLVCGVSTITLSSIVYPADQLSM